MAPETASKGKLSFGFKPASASSNSATPSLKKAVFDDDADQDDDEDGFLALGKASSSKATKKPNMTGLASGKSATPASKADRIKQQEAEQIDASIFDYDSVYDTIKEAERKVRATRTAESASKKPKYVTGILESAEQRKRDRLRSEARTIQKQREAEGDEFADTEAFVTNAYKEQQAELSRAEEEEELAEEEQRRKAKGMSSFYRDMLEQSSAVREAAISASLASKSEPLDSQTPAPAKKEEDKAQEARRRGLTVELNDDNEIVDQRQLLTKGLNIVSKTKDRGQHSDHRVQAESRQDKRDQENKRQEDYQAKMNRDSQRARQSAQIEAQMLELERKRQQQEEQDRLKEIERVNAKRNNVAAISDAKQRYLERKRKKDLDHT